MWQDGKKRHTRVQIWNSFVEATHQSMWGEDIKVEKLFLHIIFYTSYLYIISIYIK